MVDFNKIDKEALNLTRAIGLKEGGGKMLYTNTTGDKGTSRGAYQWQPGNFERNARDAGLDPNDFSPTNQDKVAYATVKKMKDNGLLPHEIAAVWNGGDKNRWDENYVTPSGLKARGRNEKLGIDYDVPGYVSGVKNYYTQLATGQNTNQDTTQQPMSPNQQPVPEVSGTIPMTEEKPSIGKRILGGLNKGKEIATNVGVGVGSSIGKAGLDLGKAFLKLSAITAKKMGSDEDYQEYVDALESIKQKIYNEPFQQELETTAGKAGNVIGQGATFIAPSGAISSAANKASGLITGTGKAAGVARTVAGGVAEGLGNYGVGYGLSGGDLEDAKTAGLTSGILKIGVSGVGEILKGLKIDKALMKNIFGTTKKEVNAINSGQKIKTLAEEALDRGIKGNTEQITMQISDGLAASEQKIMDEFRKAGNPNIKITNKKPIRFICQYIII